jgi:hypothetical protein
MASVEPMRSTVAGPCGFPVYGNVVEPVMTIDELKRVIANGTSADVAGK